MVESTKDEVENNLKETEIREQKEALAATRPIKKDEFESETAKPSEFTSDEAIPEGSNKEPLKQFMDDEEFSSGNHSNHNSDHLGENSDDKFRLEFFGSEILRQKAPKAFEVADAVAQDWVHDGSFSELPLENPTIQAIAQLGLRRAKDIEKKLDEKGVFLVARTGVEFLKSKLKK